MFTKPEIVLFDKIAKGQAPYKLPVHWTAAIRGLWLKNAIVVYQNCARITPEGYQMRDEING